MALLSMATTSFPTTPLAVKPFVQETRILCGRKKQEALTIIRAI
jgi:hypothetical protein